GMTGRTCRGSGKSIVTRRSSIPCRASVGSSSPRCSQNHQMLCSGETIMLCAHCAATKWQELHRYGRHACNRRLRNAAFNWGTIAVRYDPISKAKYEALRARGHGHARVLRSVVDRLLYVACTMLEKRTLFDPPFVTKGSAA